MARAAKQEEMPLARAAPVGALATLVSNGKDVLAIPEGELRLVDSLIEPDDSAPWTEANGGRADWTKAAGDLCIAEQPATAVYWNTKGAVVIRQEDPYGDDDPYVMVQPHNLPALILRLEQMRKQGGTS